MIVFHSVNPTLPEKCPYLELFWFIFSRIQSKCGKIRSTKTPNTGTFDTVLWFTESSHLLLFWKAIFFLGSHVLESLFNKVAGLQGCNLFKRDSNTGVYCEYCEIFRTLILKNMWKVLFLYRNNEQEKVYREATLKNFPKFKEKNLRWRPF